MTAFINLGSILNSHVGRWYNEQIAQLACYQRFGLDFRLRGCESISVKLQGSPFIANAVLDASSIPIDGVSTRRFRRYQWHAMILLIAIKEDAVMAAVTVRNLSDETHRALKVRAARHGRSTEAEIRAILEHAANPPERIKLGSELAAIGREFGGVDLDIERDKTPTEALDFE